MRPVPQAHRQRPAIKIKREIFDQFEGVISSKVNTAHTGQGEGSTVVSVRNDVGIGAELAGRVVAMARPRVFSLFPAQLRFDGHHVSLILNGY